MPLVTTKELLTDARNAGYAVGAFNIENLEMAQAAVRAAAGLNAPIILQTTPATVAYAGLSQFSSMVRALAELYPIPVALHLDHAKDAALAAQAVARGYTSVMIDASHKPLPENIAAVREVVAFARPNRIPVEAELGRISGKEDHLAQTAGCYTDPEEALEFVAQTQVDSLAVSIGTAHGIYQSAPCLNKELLKTLGDRLTLPLVLHGASGLPDADISDCIRLGISKVNFATDLRIAFTGAMKEALCANPAAIDPKEPGAAGMERVKAVVAGKILLCGCAGRG